MPAYTLALLEAEQRARVLRRTNSTEMANAVRFDVTNNPLPLTAQENAIFEVILGIIACLFILMPFCYLTANFAVFVVREREVKAKHLQLVSGTSPVAYWVATFCWDMLQYAIIVAGTMAVFVGFGNDSFTGCRALSRQPRNRKRVMQSPKTDGPLP